MTKSMQLSRRRLLRGAGAALALPLLDAMLPATALASRNASATPNRMAFLYVPNGMHMPDWRPIGERERGFGLPPILQTLSAHREDFQILTGLTHDKARANGDGGGDHARAMACFLTGCQPRKTSGANIKTGVSVDQIAAQQVGQETRFASLEIGCDRGQNAGSCDSGYSCAYSANASWRTESSPMSKEVDPRLIFERLFTGGSSAEIGANRAKRKRYQQSILDFVREDARQLKASLGASDQRKLDEYLSSVRELEVRISRVENVERKERPLPALTPPNGIPREYGEHIRVLGDLMTLAFQGDLTRICTFVFANEGSNRSYGFIDVPEGHHDLSHHGRNPAKQAKVSLINRFHAQQFAYILDKLKSVGEGDGTLLDHAMVVYGSAISDGDRHNHDDLPILLAGRGCGTLTPGRHLRYPKETPLNNLWLSMLDRMDASIERLGDGTGRLDGLAS